MFKFDHLGLDNLPGEEKEIFEEVYRAYKFRHSFSMIILDFLCNSYDLFFLFA